MVSVIRLLYNSYTIISRFLDVCAGPVWGGYMEHNVALADI